MRLESLLGTEFPLIQAPMAGVQGRALALAVSNAGGLGSLPCAMLSVEALRDELDAIRAVSDRPFNLNFFCHPPPAPDSDVASAWQAVFHEDYAAWGIAPTAPSGPTRQPFNHEMADVVCAYRPAVVSFHFGLPSPELLERVRSSGAKILSSATTVEEAIWLEAQGVDAIIAQGVEAGGHRGMFLTEDIRTQMGTFALVPQVVKAVNVPVIAAGGIADAAGVRAAMHLGAAGVQIGTAYLLCPEATTSAVHRAALQSEMARETVLTNIFSGRPARGIVNSLIRRLGAMRPDAPPFPLATAASAPLRAKAESVGCGDFSPLWAGQNTTGCQVIPAEALTRALVSGFFGGA